MSNAVLLQSMFQRAIQAFNGGNLEMAAVECERMLGIDRRNTAALHILGTVAFRRGDFAKAIDLLGKVLKQDPLRVQAAITLGEAQLAVGRFSDALINFRKGVNGRPDDPVQHYNLGLALRGLGRFGEAVSAFAKARDINPSDPASWNAMGDALLGEAKLDDAIACFEEALRHDAGYSKAHNNLGIALQAQGRTREAVEVLERALGITPDDPELHYNLGCSLQEAWRTDEAIASHRRAIALRPDYAPAHWNLSHSLLRAGEFAEGWREYEWRWQTVQTADAYPQPAWTGDEAAGRTILVWEEQGLGDTIQFIRFAPLLAERGWKVVVMVQKALKRLLADLPGVEILARGDRLPPFDVHAPLLSLPRLLGTSLADIPAAIPYLSANVDKVEAWRRKLPADGLRIGVAWRGNPDNKRNPFRSMPPAFLAGLLDRPDIVLVNLQKDARQDEIEAIGADRVFNAAPDLEDFTDTVALIANLDLVVSVCTSVCHLAGGMGHRTWVLLDARADWRWFEERSDSPWYPGMRLFRQPDPGDWAAVIGQVRDALAGFK